jgi:L-ascorbate metabolism protein UlaG (beta-lactamase superfamily)
MNTTSLEREADLRVIELWWLGQAGFRLRDPAGGPRVFVDPFLTPSGARAWEAPLDAVQLAREADIILVSHGHSDHFDRPTLQAAAADGHFRLVLPAPLRDEAIALGLRPERVIGAEPDQALDIDGVLIYPLPARHGINVADAYTFGENVGDGSVRYLGYVVGIGPNRLYHSGDCVPYAGQADRLKKLGVEILCLPINGRDFYRETDSNIVGNMDFREAARLAADANAQVLVPMHWELFEANRGFPGDLVAYASQHFPSLSVLVMGRGARIQLAMSRTYPWLNINK